jgi:hypothetical protein
MNLIELIVYLVEFFLAISWAILIPTGVLAYIHYLSDQPSPLINKVKESIGIFWLFLFTITVGVTIVYVVFKLGKWIVSI